MWLSFFNFWNPKSRLWIPVSAEGIKNKKEQSLTTWSDYGKDQIQIKILRYQKSLPKVQVGDHEAWLENARRAQTPYYNAVRGRIPDISDLALSQRPRRRGIVLSTNSDVKTMSNFGLYNLEEI